MPREDRADFPDEADWARDAVVQLASLQMIAEAVLSYPPVGTDGHPAGREKLRHERFRGSGSA